MLLPWSEIFMYGPSSFSVLFKRELRVILAADYVETQLITHSMLRGFKPEIVAHEKRLLPQPVTTIEGSPALLTVLAQMLEPYWGENVVPVVIASSQFSRYLIVPWNDAIGTKAESEAYVTHLFAQHYGEASTAWHFATHHTGFGKPAFSSAIPFALLTTLTEVFANAKLKLSAVYPQWMMSANKALAYMRQQRLAATAWLVCVESARLTIGRVEAGEWKVIQSMPLELFIPPQIEQWIARASVMESIATDMPVLVDDTREIAGGISLPQYRVIDLPRARTAKHADSMVSMVRRTI